MSEAVLDRATIAYVMIGAMVLIGLALFATFRKRDRSKRRESSRIHIKTKD